MKYLSVCSGIEAATVAWHPLGWTPVGFAEIEKFPSAVLAHHYPDVPNLGDFTRIEADAVGPIDLLVGGTPCQSFSVAGLRGGLDDDRGNLALEFCRLAQRTRPRWIVWENVPGVLSMDEGRAFASILGGLAECGYGLAYRVLDAQFVRTQSHPRAVPQRRRRVFVVGHSGGDWRRAAAVLFERESMRRDSPPSRKPGKDVAPTISARTQGGGGLGTDFDCDGGLISARMNAFGDYSDDGSASTVKARDYKDATDLVAHALRGEGFDASEDGTGVRTDGASYTLEARTVPQAVAFDTTQITSKENRSQPKPGDPCHPLAAGAHPPALAFSTKDHGNDAMTEVAPTMRAMGHDGSHANAGGQLGVQQGWAVRRLTPTECERLQGFPEIKKSAIIHVWDSIEKTNSAALAEIQCRKSRSNALNVDEGECGPNASAAEKNLSTAHQSHGLPVVLHVLIDLERQEVELHSAGKLIWSASTVVEQSSSPLSMQVADFVQLAANMLTKLAPTTHVGAVASQASISSSSRHLNGNVSVNLSGREIDELASDVEKFTTAVSQCMKFTTLAAGQNFQISEPIWRTWSCCVAHAIGGFIPEQTKRARSYALSVTIKHGYTNVPYRGKPAADGPRYKALGNSFAVNVVRWIGERIKIVEDIS